MSRRAVFVLSILLAACGRDAGTPPPQQPLDQPTRSPESDGQMPSGQQAAEDPVASAPAPSEPPTAPAETIEKAEPPTQVAAPQTQPTTSAPTQAAVPRPGTSSVVDPGGSVEVSPARPGLARIGAAKCELCHKVQFASWSETAHARRSPPLDCEACHGPGSEYKSQAVMKDPERARSAGLVIPGRAFCATCHHDGWTDDLLAAAHAHKGD